MGSVREYHRQANPLPPNGFLVKVFCVVAAAFLVIASIAKLISLTDIQKHFGVFDPVLPWVPNLLVVVSAAFFELAIAWLLLTPRLRHQGIILTLWLSVVFFVYRIGLYIINPSTPCECLGSLKKFVDLTMDQQNQIALAGLSFLAAGSTLCLLRNRGYVRSIIITISGGHAGTGNKR